MRAKKLISELLIQGLMRLLPLVLSTNFCNSISTQQKVKKFSNGLLLQVNGKVKNNANSKQLWILPKSLLWEKHFTVFSIQGKKQQFFSEKKHQKTDKCIFMCLIFQYFIHSLEKKTWQAQKPLKKL